MRLALVLPALSISGFIFAAEPSQPGPPRFEADGVTASILSPGWMVTIYGSNLGPQPPCAAQPDPQLRETVNPHNPDPQFANLSVYPTGLCETQVLISGRPAGLLYVSPGQINFKVPQDSPESGYVDLRVVHQGQSSAPVRMEAGFGETTVSLAETAYAGMPVWLKVDLRPGLGRVDYPYLLGPAGFGCNQVEVRREGKPLPQLPGSNWARYGMAYSGPACGNYSRSSSGRLPLHLLYRFDQPGSYEVRYTLNDRAIGRPAERVRTQSEWTRIEILPARPGQRRELLESLRKRGSANASALLDQILPDVLGYPDGDSLEFLISFLDHPDESVRRYAANGLWYFPQETANARLLARLRGQGPTPELARFLLQQPEVRAQLGKEIVAASLPYLASDSALVLDGAVEALQLSGPQVDPAALEALARAAGHIFALVGPQYRNNAIQLLAGRFPELKNASEADIAAFLRTHSRN